MVVGEGHRRFLVMILLFVCKVTLLYFNNTLCNVIKYMPVRCRKFMRVIIMECTG